MPSAAIDHALATPPMPPLAPPDGGRGRHLPVLMLVLATALWGAGFTWAQHVQQSINDATRGQHAMLGPLLFLAARFTLAGVVWTALVPAARRGWTRASLARSLILGTLLAAGMALQHLSLDRTSPAVAAFLTALVVVFVPLLSVAALGRAPGAVAWAGVAIATLGVWRMTGASPRGFGQGEILGIACAAVFAVHLLAVNLLVPRDDPLRLNGGQFLVIGLACAAVVAIDPGNRPFLRPAELARLATLDGVPRDFALMMLPTLGAFSLMMIYQPRVDPTRAALVYLLEPVWAGTFAWLAAGKPMTAPEVQGAALILVANALVELISSSRRRATGG